jgi:hypothetical protein
VAFAPVDAGFAVTTRVHVPPDPVRFPVVQVSLDSVKSVVLSIECAEQPVAVSVPEFVRVKVGPAELEPTFTFPKSWVSGVQARLGATPVTTIWLVVVVAVPPKVQVRERVVAFEPAVVGLPRTRTVHVALDPARSFVAQLSVVIVKFVVSATEGAEHPVAVAVPALVRVKVWVEEFEPTFTFPKS